MPSSMIQLDPIGQEGTKSGICIFIVLSCCVEVILNIFYKGTHIVEGQIFVCGKFPRICKNVLLVNMLPFSVTLSQIRKSSVHVDCLWSKSTNWSPTRAQAKNTLAPDKLFHSVIHCPNRLPHEKHWFTGCMLFYQQAR